VDGAWTRSIISIQFTVGTAGGLIPDGQSAEASAGRHWWSARRAHPATSTFFGQRRERGR